MESIFDVRVHTWHNEHGRQELTDLGITPDRVRAAMKTTHRGWLCEISSKVIGFAMGDRSLGEMWVIAVLPQFQGIGVGRELLSRVEQWLFGEGWDELWLTTDVDESLRAIGFYRHLGWEDWKFENGDRYMKKRRI